MLGEFSTDRLEKAFSKLRQGSGGTYFINVQQVSEKLIIDHTKLVLRLGSDFSDIPSQAGHNCNLCNRPLSSKESEVFDSLSNLEDKLSMDTKMGLVYVAGYIVRNCDEETDCDTYEYFEKYGQYLQDLSRGGLSLPSDNVCQWTFLCYILFVSLDLEKYSVCRTSLMRYFQDISVHHSLNFVKYSRSLANIFLNNYAKLNTPRSSKEPALKVLKLSTND